MPVDPAGLLMALAAPFRALAPRLLGWLLLALAGMPLAATPHIDARLAVPRDGDGASGDNFGIAVGLAGEVAVVGAYGDVIVAPDAPTGIAQGSAWVFERDGEGRWQRGQKLIPQSLGEDGDNFGAALVLEGDWAFIAAPRRRVAGLIEAGTVHAFRRQGGAYIEAATLLSGEPGNDHRFGAALAAEGEFLVVGVPQAGDGRVEVWRLVAGVPQRLQVLEAPSGIPGARFGAALALADGDLLIGAPFAGGSGAVYRSRLQAGSFEAPRLLAVAAGELEELGAAVAVFGDLALVGAPGRGSGAVEAYARVGGEWLSLATLRDPAGEAADRYGSALAISDTRIAISALGALGGEGRVYVYPRMPGGFGAAQVFDIADGGNADRFGISLALDESGLLAGADLDQVGPNRLQGSARWYAGAPGGLVASQQLDSGDGALLDRYGSALAVAGDVAMVGAFLEDGPAGGDSGRVHWFEREGEAWQYRGTIDAPDAEVEDRFGVSIAIDGDLAAIGAYWDIIDDRIDQGSVYLFRRSGAEWLFERKLVASDGRARDLFGFSVALSGDLLLVGARSAALPFIDQGAAYVFRRNGSAWLQEARLDLPTPASAAFFGAAVALAGDQAVVGAPGVSGGAGRTNAGAAYVFSAGSAGWSLRHRLQASNPVAGAAFGFAVAADGERWLIGAPGEPFVVLAAGGAYLYRASDGTLEAILRAGSPQPGENLGIAVALAGSEIALGASAWDGASGANSGLVRTYRRESGRWLESAAIESIDSKPGDGFGRALALADGVLVAGSPFKAGDNPLEGAAYAGRGDGLLASGFE
jgi:hypothetical protein